MNNLEVQDDSCLQDTIRTIRTVRRSYSSTRRAELTNNGGISDWLVDRPVSTWGHAGLYFFGSSHHLGTLLSHPFPSMRLRSENWKISRPHKSLYCLTTVTSPSTIVRIYRSSHQSSILRCAISISQFQIMGDHHIGHSSTQLRGQERRKG